MSNPSTNEVLKSLESLYLKSEYDQAVDLLLKEKDKFDPGLFHYNLGTLYIKKEKWGPGRYHLEKATKKGFINPAQWNNLQLIKEQSEIVDLSRSTYSYERGLDYLITATPYLYYSITLLLVILLIAVQKLNWMKETWKKVIGFTLALCPTLFFFLFLDGLSEVVIMREAKIHEGPSEIYSVQNTLSPGSKVIIGRESEGWLLIKYPRDISGWIELKNIGRL